MRSHAGFAPWTFASPGVPGTWGWRTPRVDAWRRAARAARSRGIHTGAERASHAACWATRPLRDAPRARAPDATAHPLPRTHSGLPLGSRGPPDPAGARVRSVAATAGRTTGPRAARDARPRTACCRAGAHRAGAVARSGSRTLPSAACPGLGTDGRRRPCRASWCAPSRWSEASSRSAARAPPAPAR